MSESAPRTRRAPSRLAIGCSGLVVMASVVVAGLWWCQSTRTARALDEQAEQAEQMFEPADQALAAAIESPGPGYDIDRTIRVVHGLDLALAERADLQTYLREVATQDLRGVAPDVLEARRSVLGVLQQLHARQIRAADQEANWDFVQKAVPGILSIISGGVGATGANVKVSGEQAAQLYQDIRSEHRVRKLLRDEIDALDQQLFEALLDYSSVYWKYVDEWDELSILRDRAYLAMHDRDWEGVEQAASRAIEMAPHEREAHLLKGLALIEQDDPERLQEASELLHGMLQDHPQQTAPTFTLLGVLATRQGATTEARRHFEQSAAYYPKQASHLLDMLDPYEMRAFLQGSREGQRIVEEYQATMLGAGYFSPDLQLARMAFAAGDFEAGRAKVMDHFARRRSQKQWNLVISDLEFCYSMLGDDFRTIFPDDGWLDLETSRSMMGVGSGLALSIRNRGDQVLHNATLIVTLQLTDMFPGTTIARPAPETVPALLAHEETSFGVLEADWEVGGEPKGVDDIVLARAILVSDEAVVWVDTDEYRFAEVEARKRAERARSGSRAVPEAPAPDGALRRAYDEVLGKVNQSAKLFVEDQMFSKDGVRIELPRGLSLAHPVFRLEYGGQTVKSTDNRLDGERIVLRFAGVGDLAGDDATNELQLVAETRFGDATFRWTRSAPDKPWRFAGITSAQSK